MPTARFIHDGDAIDYTPGGDVAAGDVILLGTMAGVAKRDIPANTLGALAVTGVYEMPKPGGVGMTFMPGAEVYWNTSADIVEANDGGGTHTLIGKAAAMAADGDTSVLVRLSP